MSNTEILFIIENLGIIIIILTYFNSKYLLKIIRK
jgi:hypothetical protein